MKKIILISLTVLFLITPFLFIRPVLAMSRLGPCAPNEIETILGCAKDLKDLFTGPGGLVDWAFNIIGILSVAMLIFGGLRYAASAGNPDGLADAKNIISTTIIALAVLILGNSIFAIITGDRIGPVGAVTDWVLKDISDFTSVAGLTTLVQNIIRLLSALASPFILFFLILGGLRYMTAAGSQEAVAQAKKMLAAAIIGAVVIILSNSIVYIVHTWLTTAPK